ncbi:hypothetical protein VE01_10439 [Pseudogymnoascus verrucosus]|uniref:RRM domain-containing protein n=1 Tax=Pseudogymnoascus verrucosus TaxID=342668 RepID=A0A1B8G6S0_9PEZI|nr:uncharacterized protein VE01_10439 [Pseudogymnoascus verrucosus]OBT91526.1 hypothetical protein VE01_10439 [Pseudogymnoascus verrucosus]
MSYPPPPGLSSYSKSTSQPSSLPARPPPSAVPAAAFKPNYANPPSNYAAAPYQSQGFVPRGVQPPAMSAPAYGAQPSYNSSYQSSNYGGQQGYQAEQQQDAYGTPQIRNPFPLPGQPGAAGHYDAAADPEMEAQIAQWQSAYSKDNSASTQPTGRPTYATNPSAGGGTSGAATSANAAPLGGREVSSAVNADTGVATVVGGKDGKQATVVRSGGGTQWTDSSLLEWDPAHFRIFVGNLAGEVTDESLLKAFARWPSVQKARVVRDKRTTKSKGFGFVSFADGDDFFQAAREMQGKYIGSHPVLIKRSTTEIKAVVPRDNKRGRGGRNNRDKDRGKGGQGVKEGGVQKAGQKTKGGLKILG